MRRPLLIMTAAAALCGCADYGRLQALAPSGVDASNPAADVVRTAQISRPPYPSLAHLPPKPTDVRAPGAYGVAAGGLRGEGGVLQRWTAANPPLTTDPEAFAAAEQRRIPGAQRDVPVADQAAQSAAWAARLREAAKPPPPPSS